jgi:hypothetical protein
MRSKINIAGSSHRRSSVVSSRSLCDPDTLVLSAVDDPDSGFSPEGEIRPNAHRPANEGDVSNRTTVRGRHWQIAGHFSSYFFDALAIGGCDIDRAARSEAQRRAIGKPRIPGRFHIIPACVRRNLDKTEIHAFHGAHVVNRKVVFSSTHRSRKESIGASGSDRPSALENTRSDFKFDRPNPPDPLALPCPVRTYAIFKPAGFGTGS